MQQQDTLRRSKRPTIKGFYAQHDLAFPSPGPVVVQDWDRANEVSGSIGREKCHAMVMK